jgi:hypothetical protein
MTWTVKVRGAPSTYEVAEYDCPDHGRFVLSMERPAPDRFRCIVEGCTHDASWCFPTPGAVKVSLVSFERGKSSDRPPEDVVMDTRPLADGKMTPDEFRKHRNKITQNISLRRMRAMRSR